MLFRIITAPSGLHKGAVVAKIRAYIEGLNIDGHRARVGIGDIEEELKNVCPQESYIPDSTKDTTSLIIGQVPQDKIRQLWKLAFRAAIEKATQLVDGIAPDITILITSLVYYRFETNEFYCPADSELIRGLQRSGVLPPSFSFLTIIDDIYDLYHCLSMPGEVFDIERIAKSELLNNEGRESDRYLRALDYVIKNLIRVLEWRESEIQACSSLAAAVESRCDVLAVKHPTETGVRILLGEDGERFGLGRTLPVYISHPISIPRSTRAARGSWPPFVIELGSFIKEIRIQEATGNFHIAPIMPTSIDEARILRDGERYLPKLSARWPLPDQASEEPEELLFSGVTTQARYESYETDNLQRIFDPPLDMNLKHVGLPNCDEKTKGILIGDPEVSGMLRTLDGLIRLQMANRDHLLVRQCPGFLLFRPLFNDPADYTKGVRSEIREQNRLRRIEDPEKTYHRPMAFIHCKSDLERAFKQGSQFLKMTISDLERIANTLQAEHDFLNFGKLDGNLVGDIMRRPGDPTADLHSIYLSLFTSETGSISQFPALSFEATKDNIFRVLMEHRIGRLCHIFPHVTWYWRYIALDSEGDTLYEHTDNTEIAPIILAAVLENLYSSSQQILKAAELTCSHFKNIASGPRIH